RIPLVVTSGGSGRLGMVSDATGRHSWKGRLVQRLCRGGARRADAVIVVSEHMKAYLPASARPTVIPSGLDLELFQPIPQDEARRRLGWPLDRRALHLVGRPVQARQRHAPAQDAVGLRNPSLPAEPVVAQGASLA